ncbi:MAG: phosphoserine phosphatase SerB [Candidatus Marinimicrobia bacterium]|jgi:phosphoserine phosphatase|nr:phosphoserine phosphatase SerB [Candidatus Neomarinimicrobiota bacterium]MBT3938043.1 phosphoserine phosphatase SerB [Candidatus Neomarinimicrobiota bacterium]MBT3961545.1 phosphoserine phosphatase SerB [Candidatus Neomarinimicrobiota bacterium]MBT4382067.1 phosphoserine phosphatase SerB [Candidatus Neomarinimicrobiota bacterium]MBT4636078.1 phosphoserine phosphatase SerB [Candidatus Neomarinimicrobiota bacterium]
MNHTAKSILITVSGEDQPGITSNLMNIIMKGGYHISDIGQSVTHGLLSLSILLDISSSNDNDFPVLKELLFASKTMGLNLDFKMIEGDNHYLNIPFHNFILSCVSINNIPASFLYDLSTALSDHKINIHRIENIGKPSSFNSLEIYTRTAKDIDWISIKNKLMHISSKHSIDIAFLKDNVYRKNKRLIVMDMDSTLIQNEVIDEMATVAGFGEQVSAITKDAMNGKINYNESLIQRVNFLKGLKTSELEAIFSTLELTVGAEDFITSVKKLGYKIAIISGGFNFFANKLKTKLRLDYAFANELEFEGDTLTGRVKGTIIDADQKEILLKMIAQQEEISLEQVVAIGDGANDLPMLSCAGLGIAYHAKDVVKDKAQHSLSHGPMTSILYFLGIPGIID